MTRAAREYREAFPFGGEGHEDDATLLILEDEAIVER
jgi:hypothetical protein